MSTTEAGAPKIVERDPGRLETLDTEPVVTTVSNPSLRTGLLGQRDELLRLIERSFASTTISVVGNEIRIVGPEERRSSPACSTS